MRSVPDLKISAEG